VVKKIGVELNAQPDSEADAARVIEILSRTATGLAMDGVWCELTITPFESTAIEELENKDD
jgi:hypothetical protein